MIDDAIMQMLMEYIEGQKIGTMHRRRDELKRYLRDKYYPYWMHLDCGKRSLVVTVGPFKLNFENIAVHSEPSITEGVDAHFRELFMELFG